MVTRRKKKPPRVTAEQRKQKELVRKHKAMVRNVFRSAGFERFPNLADKKFQIDRTSSDFDDVYVFENLVICIEYTVTQSSGVGVHLKKKKIVYDVIEKNQAAFLRILSKIDPTIKEKLKNYNDDEVVVKFVYCSRNSFDEKYKTEVPSPVFLDYPELRYFNAVCDCLKRSSRFELFEFLQISVDQLGFDGVVGDRPHEEKCAGSLLPEANSNFDKGFKVVSFYIDPNALLRRAYVLRKQGWRHSSNPYQRMISKSKIGSIRKHLKKNKRVFVNNVIATLADDTKIVDAKGNTKDPQKISKTQPVTIQIPDRMNTVGLIDGQHRAFSYYEGSPDDPDIAILRRKQNLLVTGIIYPHWLPEADREMFEARLFLEINSNQTNAKSNLKQTINLILEPFADESIATKVLDLLDRGGGPLSGHIERYWFDENKLKTTSIISYAMKPLVKTSGSDSLFSIWENGEKDKMVSDRRRDLLDAYAAFCVSRIDTLLIEARKQLPSGVWSPDKKIAGRILTTTNVNCLLICLRLLILNGKQLDQRYLATSLSSLSVKDFEGFHSSRYRLMAQALYEKHFA